MGKGQGFTVVSEDSFKGISKRKRYVEEELERVRKEGSYLIHMVPKPTSPRLEERWETMCRSGCGRGTLSCVVFALIDFFSSHHRSRTPSPRAAGEEQDRRHRSHCLRCLRDGVAARGFG